MADNDKTKIELIEELTYLRDRVNELERLEEQLLQSQKMEAVGRMAGGIAHNFNNMLTTIMGNAGLAEELLPEDHPVQTDLQRIQKTARRAADLTQQLLTFTRNHSNKPILCNLNELLTTMQPMLEQLVNSDTDITIVMTTDQDQVKIDPAQFNQVLVNLIINAQDSMPNGGKVTIETSNINLDKSYTDQFTEAVEGNHVLLSLSDTGIGITKTTQEHIFEPFFTTKDVGKGVGLGLTTCYGLIKQAGGHITVYSEPGFGTTFRVYIPQVKQPSSNGTSQRIVKDMPKGSENILLVEDEPTIRTLATLTLRHQGYIVIEAANGEDALKILKNQTYLNIHLLITDIFMPKMGGNTLVENLKIEDADLKVLFLSGYAEETALDKGWLNPGSRFLQKPFSPSDLSYKVREVLDM